MTEARSEEEWGDDEISLGDLISTLRRRKVSILAVTTLCLGASVAATLCIAPSYKSEARLLVEDITARSSMLGQLANLPVDLSSLMGGAPQTAAEMEVLRSRPVVRAVVGPPGTSQLVPEEGLSLTALVDDLENQSKWASVRRKLRGEPDPLGSLAVEVLAWEFPEDFTDPVLIDVVSATRVRLTVDSLWDRRSADVELAADGTLAWEAARLRLAAEGVDMAGLSGRRFRLTVRGLQKAVDLFLEDLVVEETDRGSNVLRVAYEDRDPDRLASTVNGLVRAYMAHNQERFLRRAERSVGFVDEEIERIRQDLADAESDLQAFGERAGHIVLPEAAVALVEKLVEVDLERARAGLAARTSADLLESLRRGDLTPEDITGLELSQGILSTSTQVVPLTGLLSEKRVLEATYEDEWPALEAVNLQIAERMAGVESWLENEVWRQERTEADLESIRTTYQGEMDSLPAAHLELARHSRAVRAFSEIYLFLVAQKEQATMARTAAVPSVEVIDWAVPPLEPAWPNVPLNLALGLVLGLFLGTGIALVREASQRPVVCAEQLERTAGAAHLASVPRDRRARAGVVRGEAAEAYRALRGAFRHGNEGKIIVVTAAHEGAGTSTTAAQLARTLARGGERVLLVDADLETPGLHRWFGDGKDGTGLAEALAGEGEAEVELRPTDVEDLSLLPAGRTGEHPGDLVARPGAGAVLAGFAEGYDRVILDAPAVLAGSGAAALAAAADGAVLVVRHNRTREAAAGEAALRLRQAGARLTGCVLVGAPKGT
ncbi:MAG: GNVR domain-containing protein [Planctomycetota bacterium]|nr:GNVR domain-containing protein [Planctomycetota bacterium]